MYDEIERIQAFDMLTACGVPWATEAVGMVGLGVASSSGWAGEDAASESVMNASYAQMSGICRFEGICAALSCRALVGPVAYQGQGWSRSRPAFHQPQRLRRPTTAERFKSAASREVEATPTAAAVF